MRITSNNTGTGYQIASQDPEHAALVKEHKALVSRLTAADNASFINSAYLIDLSPEAEEMAHTQRVNDSVKDILNNWREIKASLNEEV